MEINGQKRERTRMLFRPMRVVDWYSLQDAVFWAEEQKRLQLAEQDLLPELPPQRSNVIPFADPKRQRGTNLPMTAIRIGDWVRPTESQTDPLQLTSSPQRCHTSRSYTFSAFSRNGVQHHTFHEATRWDIVDALPCTAP